MKRRRVPHAAGATGERAPVRTARPRSADAERPEPSVETGVGGRPIREAAPQHVTEIMGAPASPRHHVPWGFPGEPETHVPTETYT